MGLWWAISSRFHRDRDEPLPGGRAPLAKDFESRRTGLPLASSHEASLNLVERGLRFRYDQRSPSAACGSLNPKSEAPNPKLISN
jgi:hypothetical protein